jgi:thymidylate synthase (FAD)
MGIQMKNTGKILVELQEFMGSDESIANAAWTSTYDKDRRDEKYDDPKKVESVLRKLVFNDGGTPLDTPHGVPFESVILRFWIRMPLFTDRQHMTHRIASHNGLSGRYRTVPDDWFSLPTDVQTIFDCARGSGDQVKYQYDLLCESTNNWYRDRVEELKKAEKACLITNAEFKRARETIRGVLPTAGMVERTTIFNLRSFANYQKQRNSDHAQPEIRSIAQLMLEEVEKANVAPVTIAFLKELGWKL